MKDKRSSQRYLLSLSLVFVGLIGWLYLPDRFRVSSRYSASAGTSAIFTVTTAGDGGVLCPSSEPTCTLRFAINAANSNPGVDTIRFQITGSVPLKTINLESALPAITDPVIIDGTTQPGYTGQPLIELNGAGAGVGVNGLTITGGNSTVKGLIINRFGGDGISVSGINGNTIQSNYIGTNAAGDADLGNALNGIRLRSGLNLIGGPTAAARNVISGNGGAGVTISGTPVMGNQLQRNYIGTNAAGTGALGNHDGVFISGGAATNSIGGSSVGLGNVISGNTSNGIEIRDTGSTGNKVQANFVGTDSTGNSALPNNVGIVVSSAPDATIGGSTSGARNIISGNSIFGISITSSGPATNTQIHGNFIGPNVNGAALGNASCGIAVFDAEGNSVSGNSIAFNRNDGICVLSGASNLIVSNRVFSNSRLGIDLGPDGVTSNDSGDADTGANNLQNFPLLSSAVLSGNTVTVRGTLNSTANSKFSILVFSSSQCDPSGNGEGENSFGIVTGITTDPNGNASFSLQGPPLPSGSFLTALAIKLVGGVGTETSEFSPCRQLVAPGSMRFNAASYDVNEGAGTATVTISRVGGTDGPASVVFATSNGTATAGQDYANTNGPVGFPDGQSSVTVSVPIIDDNLSESAETINLTLSDPTGGAALGTPITAVININDNDSGSVVHFSEINYSAEENCRPSTITVQRIGDTSGVSTVNYSTTSGTASDRADFTAAIGTLRFEPGELEKSFVILLTEDTHTEGTETASITLSSPSGATLGSPSIATLTILDDPSESEANEIDDSVRFVCQHYHDFLNRQPDNGGNIFWTNEIESCGTNAQCRAVKRINVSAAFFLSIEFQQTGYLVYRMYKAAYGSMPGAPVPLTLEEFLPDTQAISQGVQVGIGDWQSRLENNKNAFAAGFVSSSRFLTAFPLGMTPSQFVDALNANSGGALSPAERNQLVNELTSGARTRAQVFRAVAEDQTLAQAEFNKAFVLMQYFGYLRRNPNSIPDTDFAGYNFWLQKLNQFGGSFVDAEMVKSFLVAGEYRQRFGP